MTRRRMELVGPRTPEIASSMARSMSMGTVVAAGSALLAGSVRRRVGPQRQAHLLLAAAAGAALLSLLVGVTVVLLAVPHWADEQGQRTGWAILVSVGTTLSGLALDASDCVILDVYPDTAAEQQRVLGPGRRFQHDTWSSCDRLGTHHAELVVVVGDPVGRAGGGAFSRWSGEPRPSPRCRLS